MTDRRTMGLGDQGEFRLGATDVRPATREIVGPAEREVLEPRVMQVLVALASRDGAVVTREQLIDECWGGRVVGDDAINRTIGIIRRVAASVGQGSFQVETIVKVGYRLTLADTVAVPPSAPVADRPVRAPAIPRRLLIGGAVVVVAGAGAGVALLAGRGSGSAQRLREEGLHAARAGTAVETEQGLGFVREAARLAPGHAESWGALALARQHALLFKSADAAQAEARAAQADARRALAIDPANVSAHAALAWAIPPYANWLAAENAMRAVLARDPGQYEMCVWLSRLLARVGRMREALAALGPVTASIAMNPSLQYWQSYLAWCAGRIDECDRVIDRALRLWPRHYQVWFSRFWTLAYTGRADRALRLAADEAHRPPGIPEWNFALIVESARALGSRAPADVARAETLILDAAAKGAGFAEIGVELLSALGRVDRAYDLAESYFFGDTVKAGRPRYTSEQGVFTDRTRLNTRFLFTPATAALRADPRFDPLAARVGLGDYWKRSASRPDYRDRDRA